MKMDSNDMYPVERDEASTKFRTAIVRTLNKIFGEDVEVKQVLYGYIYIQSLILSQ
jgi:hypothetical protein